ncbi:hypothetical protein, partial [Pseudomonas fragi]|uniref:hypothetical protein n=1 Tax=Pseudomonas fragi TaxID=296 RepID=UPI001C52971C
QQPDKADTATATTIALTTDFNFMTERSFSTGKNAALIPVRARLEAKIYPTLQSLHNCQAPVAAVERSEAATSIG